MMDLSYEPCVESWKEEYNLLLSNRPLGPYEKNHKKAPAHTLHTKDYRGSTI